MTDPPDTIHTRLAKANAAYRDAKKHADEIVKPPREHLTALVVEAYQAGMIKADILRAINHAWSRQWLDEVLRDVTPPRPTKKKAARKRA